MKVDVISASNVSRTSTRKSRISHLVTGLENRACAWRKARKPWWVNIVFKPEAANYSADPLGNRRIRLQNVEDGDYNGALRHFGSRLPGLAVLFGIPLPQIHLIFCSH